MDLPFDVGQPRAASAMGAGDGRRGESARPRPGSPTPGLRSRRLPGSTRSRSASSFIGAAAADVEAAAGDRCARFSRQHQWRAHVRPRECTGTDAGRGRASARSAVRSPSAPGASGCPCSRSGAPRSPVTPIPTSTSCWASMASRSSPRRCDAIVSAVPETADTVDLFDAKFFAAMRPGALFVNVGRGSAVVEEALVEALRSGHLAGAAIDVVRDEPLTARSHRSGMFRTCWISPHSATVTPSASGPTCMSCCARTCARYLARRAVDETRSTPVWADSPCLLRVGRSSPCRCARSPSGRVAAATQEVEQLVEATYRVVSREGTVDPRVRDILLEAGLSTQVFYRHFRSKDDLLLVLLDDGRRRFADYLTPPHLESSYDRRPACAPGSKACWRRPPIRKRRLVPGPS